MTARDPLFKPLVWNAEADALLGVQSDRSVARILGVHPITVGSRRKALGIKPWQQPKHQHQRVCAVCQERFVIFGGRRDQLRLTCSKDCQTKLIRKKLALASPANKLKRVQGLLELHVLRDKE